MRWSRFLPVSTVSALIWALAFGVGAYLIGPSITDIAADVGLAGRLRARRAAGACRGAGGMGSDPQVGVAGEPATVVSDRSAPAAWA